MALRIILVDDHEPVRGLLRTLLADAGHVIVAEAADGRDGVRQTVAARPDLVIMDWSMPLLDGVAATGELHTRCPGVAVLAFSSAGDPGVREAFLAAGAIAYLDKPDVDGLLAAVGGVASQFGAEPPADEPRGGVSALDEPQGLFVRSWPALARVHIAVRGALRADATRRVLTAVTEHAEPGATIFLDLSDVTAIDEPGGAVLRECRRAAEARGAELEFHDPSPPARRALRTHQP